MPTSSTLIYGQRDAVLADALLTVELTHALVEWVAASGKNLTTIDVTHGQAYGRTWFTWPNGCVNLMCWWRSCDSYRRRLTLYKGRTSSVEKS